jgi:ATP-dependent helicase/nuclease subunit A
MLPAERFYPELESCGEEIFVQGIIDVLFDDGKGLVLLDYKSDHSTDSAAIAKRYQTQLSLYAEAVETILERQVQEKYLYLFSTGQLVRL